VGHDGDDHRATRINYAAIRIEKPHLSRKPTILKNDLTADQFLDSKAMARDR